MRLRTQLGKRGRPSARILGKKRVSGSTTHPARAGQTEKETRNIAQLSALALGALGALAASAVGAAAAAGAAAASAGFAPPTGTFFS
ncbi:hypothetical protein BH09MYX1_BH09MYX1_30540 [soil metagenome]